MDKYSTWLCKFAQLASTFVNLCSVCTAHRVRDTVFILYIANIYCVFDENFESNLFFFYFSLEKILIITNHTVFTMFNICV